MRSIENSRTGKAHATQDKIEEERLQLQKNAPVGTLFE
jgi:hypothetical protein